MSKRKRSRFDDDDCVDSTASPPVFKWKNPHTHQDEDISFATIHALRRFEERFPNERFITQLDSAKPFGAQRNSEFFLLSDCDAVFVIKVLRDGRKSVRTVLPKAFAISNMQDAGVRYDAKYELVDKLPATDVAAEQQQSVSTLSPEQLVEVWALAKECATEDHVARQVAPKRPWKKHRSVLEKSGFELCEAVNQEFKAIYYKIRTELADTMRRARDNVSMNDNLPVEFVPGETVICVPVLPGFENLAGCEGVVKEKVESDIYRIRFGKKIVRVSAKELKRCGED